MVVLQNISKRMLVLNLSGEHMKDVQGTHGFQKIKTTTVDHLSDGTLYARQNEKRLPASITFCANERIANLPDKVLECPDVKGALARRELRIVLRTPDEDPKAEPQAEKVTK